MRMGEGNPAENVLPEGITEAQLADAISKSGYPLQCVVARLLRDEGFWVQEEWSYVDRDSGELRTLDLHARLHLWDWNSPQPRARPQLDLLIECKQSDLPYVFFLCPSPAVPLHFPMFAGLADSETLTVSSEDDASLWHLRIAGCLGLQDHPFLAAPAACSTTLAKCERKGKGLELSGAEPFNSLVLPLTKGVLHFQRSQSPPPTAVYVDCHLVLAIGVVDAPMMAATPGDQEEGLTATPWVRLFRHEAVPAGARGHRGRERVLAVDLIHKEFLGTYVRSFVAPFATLFSGRVLKHEVELADGRGFISGMGRDSWTRLEERLGPCTAQAQLARARAIAANVGRLLRNLTRGKLGVD